jgi:hypothetical protein
MSKIGIAFVVVYIIIAIRPLWFAFADPGNSPYVLLGSRFGLFVVTLPGSMLVDWCKSFVDQADYSSREKIESLVYIISFLVNSIVLYFVGTGVAKLYAYFFK